MLHSTLCYLERDGQYLMLHRVKKQNDANHDKWIGVGGKFEEGESPEDCVTREDVYKRQEEDKRDADQDGDGPRQKPQSQVFPEFHWPHPFC